MAAATGHQQQQPSLVATADAVGGSRSGCGGGGGATDGAEGARSSCAAGAAAASASSPAPAHVFLSHAGEQKRSFVDCLHTLLTVAYDVGTAFLDERSLVPGTYNEPAMLAAVGQAPLGALLVLRGQLRGRPLGRLRGILPGV